MRPRRSSPLWRDGLFRALHLALHRSGILALGNWNVSFGSSWLHREISEATGSAKDHGESLTVDIRVLIFQAEVPFIDPLLPAVTDVKDAFHRVWRRRVLGI